MGIRHQTRKLAVQALYGLDANSAQGVEAAIEAAKLEAPEESLSDDGLLFVLVSGAWERQADLDRAITKVSRNWKLSRMDRVDRSILRLGIFELLAQPEVPAPVILSEAVELAKEFGAPDSPAFINGLLDKIAREFRKAEVKDR